MKKLLLVLIALAMPLMSVAPLAAAPGGGAITMTLGFGPHKPENAYYRFRVPGASMACQGKIRYYFQGDRQISTIKMIGKKCLTIAMKADYGKGYEEWDESNSIFEGLEINKPKTKRIKQIMYQLCAAEDVTGNRVCTKVHRTRQ